MMGVRRARCRMLPPGFGQTDDLTERMTNMKTPVYYRTRGASRR